MAQLAAKKKKQEHMKDLLEQQQQNSTIIAPRPQLKRPLLKVNEVSNEVKKKNDLLSWREALKNERILKQPMERKAIESTNMDCVLTIKDEFMGSPKAIMYTPPLCSVISHLAGIGKAPKRVNEHPSPYDHTFWMILTRDVDPDFLRQNKNLDADIREFFLRLVIAVMNDLINMYESGLVMKDTVRSKTLNDARKQVGEIRKATGNKKTTLNATDPDMKNKAYQIWIDNAKAFFNKVIPEGQEQAPANGEGTGEEQHMEESQSTEQMQQEKKVDSVSPEQKAKENAIIEHWAKHWGLDKEYIAEKFEGANAIVVAQKVWIPSKGNKVIDTKARYFALEAEYVNSGRQLTDQVKMDLMKQAGFVYRTIEIQDSGGNKDLRKLVVEAEENRCIDTLRRGFDINVKEHMKEWKLKMEDPFKEWIARGAVVIPRIYRDAYANKDGPYGVRLVIDGSIRQLKRGHDVASQPMATSDTYYGMEAVEDLLNDYAGYSEHQDYSEVGNETVLDDGIGPNEGGQTDTSSHSNLHEVGTSDLVDNMLSSLTNEPAKKRAEEPPATTVQTKRKKFA